MRALVIVLVLMAVSPLRGSTAAADEKWCIGAGLFVDRGEATLMRRLSERTLLGIEVRGFRREGQGDPIFGYLREWSVAVGPRIRRFVGTGSALSPYWDVFVNGTMSGEEIGLISSSIRARGIDAGFGFGVEYSTPWRFSVAGHSDVLSGSWARTELRDRTAGKTNRGSVSDIALGLSPALFVRVYF